jgi:hypothetical protein
MSRLIDELKKTDRTSYQTMGFRTSYQAPAGPRLRLIAGTGLKGSPSVDYTNGADAILISPEKSLTIDAVKTAVEQLKEIPWGVTLKDTTGSDTTSLVKEGCDFFIFPAASQVSLIPSDGDTGRIIEIEPSLDNGLIRAINDIPVDAVLVNTSLETEGALVWHQLVTFQHITNILNKPVIVRIPLEISENDIKSLWEAGADAAIAEIDTQKQDGINNLRKLIDSLPARKFTKKGSTEAILPYPREAKAEEPEPEEGDEDRE